MVAAHDVGKAVNPLSCEGQIEGGVVMSMGYALRERYPIDDNCKPIEKYGSLGLFRAHEVPEIEAIVIDKPGLNVRSHRYRRDHFYPYCSGHYRRLLSL